MKTYASPVTAVAAAVAGALASPAIMAAAPAESTAITIYSFAAPGGVPAELYRPTPGSGVPNGEQVPGYALVRHERPVQVAAGRSNVRFTDVAALIDPTTVTFTSLTDPATRVVEQNFQFDLVSTDKLLLKYIDKPIVIERAVGNQSSSVSGTLLSSNAGGLVVRDSQGNVNALNNYSAVRFQELPGGLITRPTLMWDLNAARAGEQRARVTYQTGGITWWADYNLIFSEGKDANSGTIDLSAWVSIINLSGATYPEAKLKLVAGDVHRAPVAPSPVRMRAMDEITVAAAKVQGFEEKSFDEFHLYTLGRPSTLPNNSTKQIELFDQAKKIPAKRTLVYNGAAMPYFSAPMTDRNFGVQGNTKVDSYLELRNDKASGLGVPLPAGRIRVSKLDTADDTLEFIGEDAIDHTPKDESVRVKLGSAFDVVGERRQVDFTSDTKAKWMEEEFEIKVRNHKAQSVEVQVRETLYRWSKWNVVTKTQDFQREDARTIVFPVKIAADGEATVRYRVRYSW